MATNLETDPLLNDENYKKRISEFKQITLILIYAINGAIIFLIYNSYVADNYSEDCILTQEGVKYLEYQYVAATIICFLFSAIFFWLKRNNAIRKYFLSGMIVIAAVSLFVYSAMMTFVYWPEMITCNYAFVFSFLGIVILDVLFVLFVLDKIIVYFSFFR